MHTSSTPSPATRGEREDEDPDIFLIKIMCEHVGVLKESSFMHGLFNKWSVYLFIFSKQTSNGQFNYFFNY